MSKLPHRVRVRSKHRKGHLGGQARGVAGEMQREPAGSVPHPHRLWERREDRQDHLGGAARVPAREVEREPAVAILNLFYINK